MATEVNQALAAHAQQLLDQAAGRGQRAIDQVEADLERFARLLLGQVRLRKALADPGLPPEPKRALLTELGQGRLDEVSVELLATAATRQRVRLRDFPALVAEVRSAVELDDQRRVRLAEALTRVLGKPVVLQVTVDEAILGSVVVRVGDELFDGSIRSRLEQAREALGVA